MGQQKSKKKTVPKTVFVAQRPTPLGGWEDVGEFQTKAQAQRAANKALKAQQQNKAKRKQALFKIGDGLKSLVGLKTKTVAPKGTTKTGDRSKVATHERKLSTKEMKAIAAHEKLKTVGTHTDLSVTEKRNPDGSVVHYDSIEGWELKRINLNGQVTEQPQMKTIVNHIDPRRTGKK